MKKKIFIAFFLVVGLKAEKENFAFFTRNNKIHDHLEREVKDDLSIAFASDFGLIDLSNVSGTKDNSADDGFSGSEVKSVNDSSQNSNTVTQASNKSDEVYRDFNGSETSCSDRSKVVDHNNESSNNFRGLHAVSQPSNAQEANAMPSDSETASQQLDGSDGNDDSRVLELISQQSKGSFKDDNSIYSRNAHTQSHVTAESEKVKINFLKHTSQASNKSDEVRATLSFSQTFQQEDELQPQSNSKFRNLNSIVEQAENLEENNLDSEVIKKLIKEEIMIRFLNVSGEARYRKKIEESIYKITHPLDCLEKEEKYKRIDIDIESTGNFRIDIELPFIWGKNDIEQIEKILLELKEEIAELEEKEQEVREELTPKLIFEESQDRVILNNSYLILLREAQEKEQTILMNLEKTTRAEISLEESTLISEYYSAIKKAKHNFIEQKLLGILKETEENGFASKAYEQISEPDLKNERSILNDLNNYIYNNAKSDDPNKSYYSLLNTLFQNLKNSSYSDENKKQMCASVIQAVETTLKDAKILEKIKNKSDDAMILATHFEDMCIFLLNIKKTPPFEEFENICNLIYDFYKMKQKMYDDKIEEEKNRLRILNEMQYRLLYIKKIYNVYKNLVDSLEQKKFYNCSDDTKKLIDERINFIKTQYIKNLGQLKLKHSASGVEYIKSIYNDEKDLSNKEKLCKQILDFYKYNKELAKTEQAEWELNLKIATEAFREPEKAEAGERLLSVLKEMKEVGLNSDLFEKISEELKGNIYNVIVAIDMLSKISENSVDLNFAFNQLNHFFKDFAKENEMKNYLYCAFEKTIENFENQIKEINTKLDNNIENNYNVDYIAKNFESVCVFWFDYVLTNKKKFEKLFSHYILSIATQIKIIDWKITKEKESFKIVIFMQQKLSLIESEKEFLQSLVEKLGKKSQNPTIIECKNHISDYINDEVLQSQLTHSTNLIKYMNSIYDDENDYSCDKSNLYRKITEYSKSNKNLIDQVELQKNSNDLRKRQK